MHIINVEIRNIQSIDNLHWEPGQSQSAGWHVILGDNGSGKSSFLRALTLALLGPKEAIAARQDWNDWLRRGTSDGAISLDLQANPNYDFFSGKGRVDRNKLTASISLARSNGAIELRESTTKTNADRHIWGDGSGWFSASYGPFRRFSGGDKESERIFLSNPKLGAHISVFGESVALTECLLWLRDLNYKRLEDSSQAPILERLTKFVNQKGFLPHDVKLEEISSRGVEFRDPDGFLVEVEALSDGYRSILSMTFELIRQLARVFPPDKIFDDLNQKVVAPGVVMIDEIDAHLHPTWQNKIGFWLTDHFPSIQFIVTTHSPLICHAALNGSIFRLPAPGSGETGRLLEGIERDRIVFGDILDAYSTESFGTAATRSLESQQKQDRLAALNLKELLHELTDNEKQEQQNLRSIFPTSPHLIGEGKSS